LQVQMKGVEIISDDGEERRGEEEKVYEAK
jgi:hypothetical protein